MDPLLAAILFFCLGVLLIVAEMLLPTGGVLGVFGILGVLGALGLVFTINPWVGGAMLIALLLIAPLIGGYLVNRWPRTNVGRQVILQENVPPPPPKDQVELGRIGVAVTDLRPMGECEFDDLRVEAIAEYGMIPTGQAVKVVALSGKRPTVRAVEVESTVQG